MKHSRAPGCHQPRRNRSRCCLGKEAVLVFAEVRGPDEFVHNGTGRAQEEVGLLTGSRERENGAKCTFPSLESLCHWPKG